MNNGDRPAGSHIVPYSNLQYCDPGLTKREMFAMAAMQGLLACEKNLNVHREEIGILATEYADALLEVLEAGDEL